MAADLLKRRDEDVEIVNERARVSRESRAVTVMHERRSDAFNAATADPSDSHSYSVTEESRSNPRTSECLRSQPFSGMGAATIRDREECMETRAADGCAMIATAPTSISWMTSNQNAFKTCSRDKVHPWRQARAIRPPCNRRPLRTARRARAASSCGTT